MLPVVILVDDCIQLTRQYHYISTFEQGSLISSFIGIYIILYGRWIVMYVLAKGSHVTFYTRGRSDIM